MQIHARPDRGTQESNRLDVGTTTVATTAWSTLLLCIFNRMTGAKSDQHANIQSR
jgi:hypothetical protein